MTLISVIIPTCDRPRLFESALQCVRSQTINADIEVIIIDVGRTDVRAQVLSD